jgi:hypothetical protein
MDWASPSTSKDRRSPRPRRGRQDSGRPRPVPPQRALCSSGPGDPGALPAEVLSVLPRSGFKEERAQVPGREPGTRWRLHQPNAHFSRRCRSAPRRSQRSSLRTAAVPPRLPPPGTSRASYTCSNLNTTIYGKQLEPRYRSGARPVGRRRRGRGPRGHRGRPPCLRDLTLVPGPQPAPSGPERDGRPLRRPRRRAQHASDQGERQEDRRRPVRGDIPEPHPAAQRGPGADRGRQLGRGRAGTVVQHLRRARRRRRHHRPVELPRRPC